MAIRLQAGGHRRLRGLGARRRRRRHVVGEHLSGLPVRHPLAPLLVLVRAQPGLDAAPTRCSPRSSDYLRDVRRAVRRARPHPLRLRGDGAPRGTRPTDCWRVETIARARSPPTLLIAAPGLPERAVDPRRCPGLDRFEGDVVPHGALEPRPRPHAAGAWRWSAPAPRRSRPCPRSSRSSSTSTVFQRTPPWVMPHRDRPITELRAAHVPPLPGAAAAVARRRLLEPRGCSCPASSPARAT